MQLQLALPATPSARPVRGIRLGSQAPKPLKAAMAKQRETGPFFIYRPAIRLYSAISTHPRWMQKVFGRPKRRYLSPNYFAQFPKTDVDFTSFDNKPLKGYWMPATTPSSKKTVILGHGYSADWRTMAGLAKPLTLAGYNVFMFDFRGHGASSGTKTTFGLDEGLDVMGAVDFLKARYPQATEKLYYYGHSMGASAIMLTPLALEKAPGALARLNKALGGMVLDAPYADASHFLMGTPSDQPKKQPKKLWMLKFWKVFGPIKKRIHSQALRGLRTNSPKWLRLSHPLDEMLPGKVLAQSPLINQNIMLMHGDADTTTPYQAGLDNAAALGTRPNVQFVTLPGTAHVGTEWEPSDDGQQFASCVRGDQKQFVQRIITYFNGLSDS